MHTQNEAHSGNHWNGYLNILSLRRHLILIWLEYGSAHFHEYMNATTIKEEKNFSKRHVMCECTMKKHSPIADMEQAWKT
ncbi:CLUMA_CG006140, isoform A [Clunio marinus]|uniref:CLUMA_CG006140, isoform A n=1 Tax=Clunio marinus TaxID=568069 RepID=A0A1J1HX06_9DIPT|nr:CLUMA_CG006140, isoform A [Clunio marinus]